MKTLENQFFFFGFFRWGINENTDQKCFKLFLISQSLLTTTRKQIWQFFAAVSICFLLFVLRNDTLEIHLGSHSHSSEKAVLKCSAERLFKTFYRIHTDYLDDSYLFKVSNKNFSAICEICSYLTKKTT